MASAASRSFPEPSHRRGLGIEGVIVSGLAPFFLLACAGAGSDSSVTSATYRCENGASFSAAFFGRSARVTTPSQSYLLVRRPSSIGRKYSAGDVFFIQDEDRGVLVGAADGPYRRCAEF